MAELVVDQKSILELLNFGKAKMEKFVIPDYQRPYAWENEECETLWNDIVENFQNGVSEYFLGTIVTYKDGKNIAIIDGQQRVTSFFLLLRAFYHKMEKVNDEVGAAKLKIDIESCIWDTDELSGKIDKEKVHLQSFVAADDAIETLASILDTGEPPSGIENNYAENYRLFKQKCEENYDKGAQKWYELCAFILHKCIVLPIECEHQDTALTIFDTLNNRGKPLADSDIFKAKIYKNIETPEDKKAFAEKWKELTQLCTDDGIKIDDIFRCYMFVLRAREGDISKEIGMRKFYLDNKKNYFKDSKVLINEIEKLTYFWGYVKSQTGYPDQKKDGYSFSIEAKKWLHCLFCYPNDYWKYPVSVFFLKNWKSATFDNDFCSLLKKLIALLFSKFIVQPAINAVALT